MKNVCQQAASPGRALRRGPVIAGLALALPLGVGAGAVARTNLPAHPVAAVVAAHPEVVAVDPAIVAQRVAIARPAAASPVMIHRARTSTPAHGGAPAGSSCDSGVVEATSTPFFQHMNHAHFERSPQQQAGDISQTSQYVQLHAVLIQTMIAPATGDVSAIPEGTGTPFMEHMDHAHIHRSPQQQASDAQATDDYVKLHTVLIERMLAPLFSTLGGDC